MSEDVEGARDKAEHDQHQASAAHCASTEEREHRCLQLLPMEDLVPLSQTLISPTLARLLNFNTPPPPPPNAQPGPPQRHLATAHEPFHSHYVELQQMQQLQEDDPSRGVEEDDCPKYNAEDPGRMHHILTSGSFIRDGKGDPGAPTGFKRSYANAGLSDSYGMQLSDADCPDDQVEGFGMSQLVERENSSNSGDGGTGSGGGGGAGSSGARTLKRPRLVWTPQLHKRFVDAVSHLGIKNAVPKTIMQLMNVEGLTRENVASHLQKYRLYLRRVQQGSLFSSCGNSPTKGILGGLDGHPHHHPLIGAPHMSPVGGNPDHHLFNSSEIPSTNMQVSTNHHQHGAHSLHRLPGTINHLIPQHIPSLLLQPVPGQHQLNQAMAVVKSPPQFNLTQHLDPRHYAANTVLSSSPIKKAAWPSPHTSLIDISAVHRMENHGAPAGGSSPPRRALTLFPH
ncbi:hypothetical protein GOP47_0012048 [Adiantum capillus-veneris]|uniref:HTH myb-type domain-containing protein n=1 Tax=Adiantum capillus-veneris TaxID=13818 RepID=A0A9D4ZI98_ADICA|nr:hypothetical protein GOP47_0012048 [Adiantum capillus-veneris]